MKKTVVLALLLVMVASVGVFAEEVQPAKPQPNNGQIAIELVVKPYAQVYVPTNQLSFEVAGNGGSASETVEVQVQSNSPIYLTVVSKGFHFKDKPSDALNEAVTYILGDPKGPGYAKLFKPNSTWEEKFQAGGVKASYQIAFQLQYRPGTDFHQILAGTYHDTIEWTVAAVN